MNKKLIYTIEVTKSASMRLVAYSLLLGFAAIVIFGQATGSYQMGPKSVVASIVIYLTAMLVHEYIHGFFFWLFGGKPKYGVGVAYFMPYAYATSPGVPYKFWQMITIGLAPFLIISLATILPAIALPELAPFLAVAFIGNFAGAVGDIWMTAQAWKFRRYKDVVFIDHKFGITIHSNDKAAAAVARDIQAKGDPGTAKNKFLGRWIVSALVLFLLVAIAPTMFAIFQVKGDILLGWQDFPIIQYSSMSDRGAAYSYVLNIWPPILAGVLFALGLALRDKYGR